MFGRACILKGKRVVLTGASGAFAKPLRVLLEREGAVVHGFSFCKDWDYENYEAFETIFPETDILILAHGSKVEQAMEANCVSFVELIERFKAHAQGSDVPREVWAVGSEIESHPHWGNPELKIYKASKDAYARFARAYYRDKSIIYRHIVPAAFTSRMGPGLISGETAAKIAMFFIKRGCRYIPVTYTGIALFNYFKFLFRYNLAKAEEIAALRSK